MSKDLNLDNILPAVQRPGRYIDHEWNSARKKDRGGVSVCFCFPDLYEVGASNLGLEILYYIVNRRSDAWADRCFTPAPDLEALLRNDSLPLFSLEAQIPLKSFDIVGFTLQYELCATNVVNMLDLAGLPLLSAQRDGSFPLVIGGGPVTANPEPFADFFDAFVLGEGEEVIGEIVEAVAALKAAGAQRREVLLRLAKIPGVYVPSLYSVQYAQDGTVASVAPVSPEVPARVEKRTVKLDSAYFPARQLVPYVQTVHNRLNVEIARGCPRRCRFCQATKYYRPWRARSLESTLALLDEGLAATGYEEVAFTSLSCTEYRDLEKLLAEVNRRYASKRVNISLPSVRCDAFSLKIAGSLSYNKRSSLTFAPEAGTARLRSVIGKDLSRREIEETLTLGWKMGWRLIKLYFMLGLPTETEADVDGIVELVRAVRRQAHGLNFNITLSPFVPKAQTPFQWVAMAGTDTLRSRLRRLGKTLPAAVKSHHIDGSLLEGVFARGDRRLSAAVVRAWQKGCRFDQWKEHLRYDVWQAAFADSGVNPEFYLFRERGAEEVLPWDHLGFGVGRDALLSEYRQSLASQPDEPVAEAGEPVALPVLQAPAAPPALKPVQRLRVRFARRGIVRFLSHLEQIEVVRRAVRRADFPLVFTAGFHPQPKISFGPAISVGYESESEYVEIELSQRLEPAQAQVRLAAVMPEGFEVLAVKRVPLFFPSLDSLLNVSSYRLDAGVSQGQIESFLSLSEAIVEKHKAGRVERIDVKPLVRELRAESGSLYVLLRFGPKKNVKPERILPLLNGMDEDRIRRVRVSRIQLFIEKSDGSLTEP